jgi:hypothetical protein
MSRFNLEIIQPVMYGGRYRQPGNILQGVPRGPAQNLIHRGKARPVIEQAGKQTPETTQETKEPLKKTKNAKAETVKDSSHDESET